AIWKLVHLHFHTAPKAQADREPPPTGARVLTTPRGLEGPRRQAQEDPGDVEADRVVLSRPELEAALDASAKGEARREPARVPRRPFSLDS
ncbi:MAG TPA: hypothetical protein VEY33_03055, partial [Gemmatimonadota bacterium]|nr:hypothetical protein [Gemmatimonadota bacterium]